MSEQEFETYLDLLGRLLRLSKAQREAIAGELRDHLQERLAELDEQGVERPEAVRLALAEFGDAAALAAEFKIVTRTHRRRWMMRLTAGSFVAALAALMAVMTMWPDSDSGPAPQSANAQQADDNPADDSAPRVVAPSEAELTEQQANAATFRQLARLIDVDFRDTPLEDVLSFLAQDLGVQFYVDQRALEDVGVQPSVPASLHLKQIRAGVALELMLEQLDLGYRLRHGIVVVTTPEEIEAELEVRIYNCRDLLAFGPPANFNADAGAAPAGSPAPGGFFGSRGRFGGGRGGAGVGGLGGRSPGAGTGALGGGPGADTGFGGGETADEESDSGQGGDTTTERPAGDSSSARWTPRDVLAQFGGSSGLMQQPGGQAGAEMMSDMQMMGGGMSPGGMGAAPTSQPRDVFSERAEQLIEIITRTVEPDSWDAVGGPGTISEYSGLIVISQTQPTHEQIDRLLEMLREAAAEALAQEQTGGRRGSYKGGAAAY